MPLHLLVMWLIASALVGCGSSRAISPTPTNLPAAPTTAGSIPAAATELPPPPVSVTQAAPPTPTLIVPPTLPPAPTPEAATPLVISGIIGPDQIPANVNPLTGETVADPATLAHRPIAIKISNSSAVVRPQSGLNSADLVFEHYAEGGITRFTAVFYGQGTDLVGPIRSGRLIDLEIPKMYDAAFAYSGSSAPVRDLIRGSRFFDRVISPDFGHDGFWRDYEIGNPNKPGWETLYTNTDTLRRILQQRDLDTPPQLPSNMGFSAASPTNGAPVNSVEVQYLGTNVFWQYDAGTGRYLRWADGEPHLDANTNQQINFRNVVVVAANHVDTLILEDEVAGGHYSIEIQLWGEGPVSIFRDGQRFDGRWQRVDPGYMLTFYDADGNVIPLAPGNTFFQVVPLGFTGLTAR
ncbi:MAG: DUF3048 domain-containing protein [Ardenticatenales bacterium]|nr:DUF3048 domain-containing protein [Ardenticatenales bacterium]